MTLQDWLVLITTSGVVGVPPHMWTSWQNQDWRIEYHATPTTARVATGAFACYDVHTGAQVLFVYDPVDVKVWYIQVGLQDSTVGMVTV